MASIRRAGSLQPNRGEGMASDCAATEPDFFIPARDLPDGSTEPLTTQSGVASAALAIPESSQVGNFGGHSDDLRLENDRTLSDSHQLAQGSRLPAASRCPAHHTRRFRRKPQRWCPSQLAPPVAGLSPLRHHEPIDWTVNGAGRCGWMRSIVGPRPTDRAVDMLISNGGHP